MTTALIVLGLLVLATLVWRLTRDDSRGEWVVVNYPNGRTPHIVERHASESAAIDRAQRLTAVTQGWLHEVHYLPTDERSPL